MESGSSGSRSGTSDSEEDVSTAGTFIQWADDDLEDNVDTKNYRYFQRIMERGNFAHFTVDNMPYHLPNRVHDDYQLYFLPFGDRKDIRLLVSEFYGWDDPDIRGMVEIKAFCGRKPFEVTKRDSILNTAITEYCCGDWARAIGEDIRAPRSLSLRLFCYINDHSKIAVIEHDHVFLC